MNVNGGSQLSWFVSVNCSPTKTFRGRFRNVNSQESSFDSLCYLVHSLSSWSEICHRQYDTSSIYYLPNVVSTALGISIPFCRAMKINHCHVQRIASLVTLPWLSSCSRNIPLKLFTSILLSLLPTSENKSFFLFLFL